MSTTPLGALNGSPINDQNVWLIVGFAGLIFVYVLLRPRAKKKDPLAGVPRFPLAKQREVEQQMSSLLVELSNMARQITAQLDTRSAKLELLIKEADEKLAELRAAMNGAAPPAPPPSVQSTAAAPVASAEEDFVSDRAAETQTVPDEPPPAPEPIAHAPDPRYAQVYALADEGRSANEIGRLLQRPTGEVELILALRPRG